MKASRTIFWFVVFVAAIGTLWYMARSTVAQHIVPSFAEYMASSTHMRTASSTYEATMTWMASSTIIGTLLSSVDATTTLSTSTSPPVFSVRSTLPEGYIRAPKGTIRILIAKTPSTRERGLSGYTAIAADQGMLFIFPKSEEVGFWMKDMDFPIDIVWMDKNKKVTGISKNISPKTYPKTFPSPGNVQFVLELNAGSADVFGLTTGTPLSF